MARTLMEIWAEKEQVQKSAMPSKEKKQRLKELEDERRQKVYMMMKYGLPDKE